MKNQYEKIAFAQAKEIEDHVNKIFEEVRGKFGDHFEIWAAVAYTQHYANGMTLRKAHEIKRKAGLTE